MKKPNEFIDRFGITEVSIVQRDHYNYDQMRYNLHYDYQKYDTDPIYLRHEKRPYIKCEIPQNKFEELADIAAEWHELLQDGECARLLMEARFINRLKRGK